MVLISTCPLFTLIRDNLNTKYSGCVGAVGAPIPSVSWSFNCVGVRVGILSLLLLMNIPFVLCQSVIYG